MFPVCAKTFQHFCASNSKFNAVYKRLNPQLFDVTLRDGLQGLTKEQQESFTFIDKINLYHKIFFIQNPPRFEIGSVVSKNVLPIFKDTFLLASYIIQNNLIENEDTNEKRDYYIVIPNQVKLKEAMRNTGIQNFSFITSVSNSFQMKNTKMSLKDSDTEIYEMLYLLEEHMAFTRKPNIKLYVSCINECPIEGKIDNDFIVHRILQLSKTNIGNICLSDTCGTLEVEDFEYIIDTCIYFGLRPSIISLHLHVKPGREDIIEKIIHKALDYKIVNFDVSMLEIGGCSVTMSKERLAPNLSYELFYKALYKYIIKNINA